MKLTPLDIRKQEFRKTLRGFDPIEVQTFLDMVAEEYERVLEDNKKFNHRTIELETKLKDYQETEKNLRETLLNVQEVKKQSEESSRRQADLVIKESELKALEIIEMARKQARQMRDEVSILKSQKESFINRLRQILISQIELLSVLEIDDALPDEALKFLDNARSRKKISLGVTNAGKQENAEDEASDIDFKEAKKKDTESPDTTQKSKDKESEKVKSEQEEKSKEDEKNDGPTQVSETEDEINEFFKKEIQIDDLVKDLRKRSKKEEK